jgi:hypothetical protein
MPTRRAELQRHLAVQGERLCDRVGAVGRVNRVADDLEAVGIGDLARTPGAEIFTVAVEHHDGRVSPLKDIDAVLRVGRDPADQPEGLAVGRFEEIADYFVAVLAGADLRHSVILPDFAAGTAYGRRGEFRFFEVIGYPRHRSSGARRARHQQGTGPCRTSPARPRS